ncbi:hypothetical protein M2401_000808 [Pseudomonas sp. JUb42]|uniref:HK97 gp10 family phage protein n=1 Tax=Pseudomonas sp. JUb42 TaxID=2940611 RepID=UPI0021673FFC|nr:HK97 gp10 family phage protein [Pseudomonas sp. JUb42]MCS3467087.1 hypothetical protein [Pseudomonas sp. JUb42]
MSSSWSIPPTAFITQIEQDLVNHMRNIATAMLGEVVLRSPVDTGRFRRNNVISIGSPVFSTLLDVDKDGAETKAIGQTVLSTLSPYTVIYIQNNLPYAEKLENGYSKQAPTGVYGITMISAAEKFK